MLAPDMRPPVSRQLIDSVSLQISFWRDGHTFKNFLVKPRELFPVFGNNIGMGKFYLHDSPSSPCRMNNGFKKHPPLRNWPNETVVPFRFMA
jgi:hypothetical protein